MRAVVQRVKQARVAVNGGTVGEIGTGLLVFLGVGEGDAEADADYLAGKIGGLRIFEDENGYFNRALSDVDGAILAISQFTLYGDCRKGRRPSFSGAARPGIAERLYEHFVQRLRQAGHTVATGRFGAMMDVSSVNWGPVTMLLDSGKGF